MRFIIYYEIYYEIQVLLPRTRLSNLYVSNKLSIQNPNDTQVWAYYIFVNWHVIIIAATGAEKHIRSDTQTKKRWYDNIRLTLFWYILYIADSV